MHVKNMLKRAWHIRKLAEELAIIKILLTLFVYFTMTHIKVFYQWKELGTVINNFLPFNYIIIHLGKNFKSIQNSTPYGNSRIYYANPTFYLSV